MPPERGPHAQRTPLLNAKRVPPASINVRLHFITRTFSQTAAGRHNPHTAMKTSGLVAVLAGASAVEAFLPSPSASLGLRQSPTTSSSCVSKAPVGRQSRAQQYYMVAAPAKEEGTVAAVPHGGKLVDLNVKTDEEKKVRSTTCLPGSLPAFRLWGRNFLPRTTTILRVQ